MQIAAEMFFKICIKRDLFNHTTAKRNDKNPRFGVIMTPFNFN